MTSKESWATAVKLSMLKYMPPHCSCTIWSVHWICLFSKFWSRGSEWPSIITFAEHSQQSLVSQLDIDPQTTVSIRGGRGLVSLPCGNRRAVQCYLPLENQVCSWVAIFILSEPALRILSPYIESASPLLSYSFFPWQWRPRESEPIMRPSLLSITVGTLKGAQHYSRYNHSPSNFSDFRKRQLYFQWLKLMIPALNYRFFKFGSFQNSVCHPLPPLGKFHTITHMNKMSPLPPHIPSKTTRSTDNSGVRNQNRESERLRSWKDNSR